MEIWILLKQNPALAVAKLKKASIPRRMKMLIDILDYYVDIFEREKEINLFEKELRALIHEEYNIEFAADRYRTDKKKT